MARTPTGTSPARTIQGGLFPEPDQPVRDASLSSCERYRYRLTRTWDPARPTATFLMLNPSTADALVDDPTIVRCCNFARSWGMGGLLVVNLYAYRATNPTDLWTVSDPVGPDNDQHLRQAFASAEAKEAPVVAAWGVNAKPERVADVAEFAGPLLALGLTKAGQPRHPLFMPKDARPTRWVP